PAIAEYGGDKYPCIIRDLSTAGAAIEFPSPMKFVPIARGFNLIVPEDRLRLSCRIVRLQDGCNFIRLEENKGRAQVSETACPDLARQSTADHISNTALLS